jgi:hypothetical protein
MEIEISHGELLDKVSILEIKMSKIKNPDKLKSIEYEFSILNKHALNLFVKNGREIKSLYLELVKINSTLWDLENKVRSLTTSDEEFIKSSTLIFKNNEIRNIIKEIINKVSSSKFRDIKEYQ